MVELCENALALYQQCISEGVMGYLQKQARLKVRRSIYTAQVVIWLMIVQRLQPRGTLATGVGALLAGAADRLLSDCERVRQRRISRRTGGYSRARKRLPGLLCKQVVQELVTRLRQILHPAQTRQLMFWTVPRWSWKLVLGCKKPVHQHKTSTDVRIGRCCVSLSCMSWKRAWPGSRSGGRCTAGRR